jgi:hypothetical protein
MLAKKKDVAFLGDRDSSRRGRKRPLFVRRRIVAKQDLIDFGRAETGNLDRRLFDNELLELDFEICKAPGAVFTQPVGRRVTGVARSRSKEHPVRTPMAGFRANRVLQ